MPDDGIGVKSEKIVVHEASLLHTA